jgi:hypothetical protein
MKRELQDQLFAEFPLLYGDHTKPMTQTAMCWGIDTGDGLYQLIYDLSYKLEKLIQEYIDKYSPLKCCMCMDYPADHIEGGCNAIHSSKYLCSGKEIQCPCKGYEASYPRASQVKEKFATLRFYMTSATEEMDVLIDEAETASAHICEICGDENAECYCDCSWLMTRCEKCAVSRDGTKLIKYSEMLDEEEAEEC